MTREVEILTRDDFLYHQLENIGAELDIRRPADIVLVKKAELVPVVKVRSKRVAIKKPRLSLTPAKIKAPIKVVVRVIALFTILWTAGYVVGASAFGQYVGLVLAAVSILLFVGAPAVAMLLSSAIGSLLSAIFSGKPQNPCGGC